MKTIAVPVIVGTLGMIKKGTDKHINNEIKILHFAQLLIPLGEFYQLRLKNITQKRQQKHR